MTCRIAWMTDIHLEFLKPWDVGRFFDEIRDQHPDAALITGDIAQSASLRSLLIQMARHVNVPVYFVLGNHDFYKSDIPDVREAMAQLTREQLGPVWMPEAGVIELAPDEGLVGHDGWSDGRYGDFLASPIILNDYLLIKSLRIAAIEERLAKLNALGDEAADFLRCVLPEAVSRYKHVFIMTHPPPFMEACWSEGKTPTLDDIHLPHFACKAVGDMLLETAQANPDTQFTVLCGHTHGGGTAQIRDNLLVLTGSAQYGKPVVQKVFEFDP